MRKWRRRAAQVRRELGISEIVLCQLLGWPWHPNRRATAPEMLWQKREKSAPLRQKNDQPHKEPDFFTRTLAFLANGNWLPDHRPSRRPLPVNANLSTTEDIGPGLLRVRGAIVVTVGVGGGRRLTTPAALRTASPDSHGSPGESPQARQHHRGTTRAGERVHENWLAWLFWEERIRPNQEQARRRRDFPEYAPQPSHRITRTPTPSTHSHRKHPRLSNALCAGSSFPLTMNLAPYVNRSSLRSCADEPTL
jgi:hypothetical protein